MAGNEKMIDSWPLPAIGDDDRPFWEAAQRGVLVMQECGDCGKMRFPPRYMCPSCHSLTRSWRELSGRGRIWSFAIPHPPLLPAFNDLAPYNVVVVELEEDPSIRLTGNLVIDATSSINAVDPETIKIGQPVQVVSAWMTEDVSLLRWVRIDE